MSCNLQLKCNSSATQRVAATQLQLTELRLSCSVATHELQAATQAWESQNKLETLQLMSCRLQLRPGSLKEEGNPCVFMCVSLYGRPLGAS